ncbi:MAG: hypothetical protein H0X66_18700 [Verrucomicrobia bacterium]|nr:hypothetical protein [Verrucomicrobiota bacterium]
MSSIPTAKFELGQMVATPNALEHIPQDEILRAIARHQAGDWGELTKDDRKANDQALSHGGRLLSVYRSAEGVKFYIITEADRSVTTVLLPEDY